MALGRDLGNEYVWGQSLASTAISSATTTNGTGVDFQDCDGPVTILANVTAVGAGTTITVHIEDSADNSTFADVTAGTLNHSVTATVGVYAFSTLGLGERYARAAVVTTGSSPDCTITVLLGCPKKSW